MKMKLKAMTLALALAPLMVSAASVYRWTDADGVIHFGDRQPTGVETEQISVRSGQPGSASTGKSARQQLDELEQRQQQASKESAAADAAATRQAQRKTNCEAAQKNLEIIRNNSRIRINEGGQLRFLTPEEISERKQHNQDIAEQSCGNEKPTP